MRVSANLRQEDGEVKGSLGCVVTEKTGKEKKRVDGFTISGSKWGRG
jgi:hypothetical protein